MKRTIQAFVLIAIAALASICISGCEQTENGENGKAAFGVELKEAGPGYVELNVSVSSPMEVLILSF